MGLEIFFRRRTKRGKPKDDMDRVIETIERFAPREYGSERDTFYYNYKMMSPYSKPLLALLHTISHKERLQSDPASFTREVFLKLKDFYDLNNRLSLSEAKQNMGLRRKFRELFLFFYHTRDASFQEMEERLKEI
ncbi:MAG: hypothetical protein GY849_20890 [Deltaproteobacteria bacterium]|nr:hypothetical protein [Deltaproteobacteria bacterium]